MNLRYEVLKAVSKNPGATANDIADAIDHDSQKIRWAITDCRKGELLSVRRDDMTNQPGYTLTEAGKKRLEEGPASKQGRNQHDGTAPAAAGDAAVGAATAAQAGDADATAEDVDVWQRPELQYLADEDYALPPADPELLASANRMLGERLERVAHVLRGCGLPALADIQCGADLQMAASALSGAYRVAVAEVAGLNADVAILQEKVDEMQREQMRGATCLSGQDRYEAAGYLVRAPKRKPRIVTKEDTARAAALAAAKAAGRADVLALVPIGRAVRGSEWRPA